MRFVAMWFACQKPVAPAPSVAAVVEAPPQPPGSPWQTTLSADHPLVGRIWDVKASTFVEEAALMQALIGVDVVLLGEKHDNADHHALQARIVAAIMPKAVAFEMLDHKDPVADAVDAASLSAAVGWEESGWPPFAIYAPVFEAAYAGGATILAAHPTKEEVRTAMMTGFDALPEPARLGLRLDRPLTEVDKAALSDEIVQSHCGHASPQVVDMMIRGQTLKDAWMARALEQAAKPVVLVAGGGHTRLDRGVPLYLDGEVRNVLLIEVQTDHLEAQAYDEAASYLWFTPRVDDEDPCEKFREQLEKMGPPAPHPVPVP